MAHEVTITLSDQAYEVLERFARSKGKAVEAAFGDVIGLLKWFQETSEQGGQILVESKGEIRAVKIA
jgi:hypothetical protein